MIEHCGCFASVEEGRGHCAWTNASGWWGGMRFALPAMRCMVVVQCNFDIPNTIFTFLMKLNRGTRCGG